MTTTASDWESDEQQLRTELKGELEAIRNRHGNDPPGDMLVAARADLLPPDVQAAVRSHLAQNAWSRAIAEGLEQSGASEEVDAGFEERLLSRIKPARPARSMPRRALIATGGLALAASLLIALFISRPREAPTNVIESPATPAPASAATTQPLPAALAIPFTKPDVKWSADAMVWRGAAPGQSFIGDVTPALEAFRSGAYSDASTAFDQLAVKYPDAIEVLFYQGVTRMLRDDFAGAIAPLTAADRLKNAAFADDVAWFLGVAEQRAGRGTDSRSRLSSLCDKGGDRAREACAAVAQLDSETPHVSPKTR